MNFWIPALALATAATPSQSAAGQEMVVEYIAHAAFVIESPAGHRVAIDPFNSNRWLGYHFPENVSADAVLVTHPHYDHDAAYYFGEATPVFREPGSYRVGDIAVRGIAAEHAGGDRYRGRGITPWNTLWVVEVGGVSALHVGDNRLLTDDDIERVGPVDILFTHPFFPLSEVAEVARRLGARVMVPMHYRLHSLTDEPAGLPTVGRWLGNRTAGATWHQSNRHGYDEATLPAEMEVHVFAPSRAVTAWDDLLQLAWVAAVRGDGALDGGRLPEALAGFERAVALAPEVLGFHLRLARAQHASGRPDEARATLERGLVVAAGDDIEPTLRARGLLAEWYLAAGDEAAAAVQYRIVLRHPRTYAADVLDDARVFFESRR